MASGKGADRSRLSLLIDMAEAYQHRSKAGPLKVFADPHIPGADLLNQLRLGQLQAQGCLGPVAPLRHGDGDWLRANQQILDQPVPRERIPQALFGMSNAASQSWRR